MRELLRTAGVEPVGELLQRRPAPDPRTYVGKGKLVELKQAVAARKRPISRRRRRPRSGPAAPSGGRAQAARGRPYAAHPGHLRPARDERRRQAPGRAGTARVQPPPDARHVGTSSASAAESDARPGRIAARATAGFARRRVGQPQAPAQGARAPPRHAAQGTASRGDPGRRPRGVHNAGNLTLLNALTDASVSVDDRLFETLDPTTQASPTRAAVPGDRHCRLHPAPTPSARRGLRCHPEETLTSDLVLHVADASASDAPGNTIAAVESVLAEIGGSELPVELVLNKIDAVYPLRRRRLANRFPGALAVSASAAKDSTSSKAASETRFRSACVRSASWSPSTRAASSPSSTSSVRHRRTAGHAGGSRGSRPASAAGSASLRAVPRRRACR